MYFIKRIYASYLHLFNKYSRDPEFAARAFLPLTVGCIIIQSVLFLDVILDSNIIEGNYTRGMELYTLLFMFAFYFISLVVEMPEPKESKLINYISISIVLSCIFVPIIRTII